MFSMEGLPNLPISVICQSATASNLANPRSTPLLQGKYPRLSQLWRRGNCRCTPDAKRCNTFTESLLQPRARATAGTEAAAVMNHWDAYIVGSTPPDAGNPLAQIRQSKILMDFSHSLVALLGRSSSLQTFHNLPNPLHCNRQLWQVHWHWWPNLQERCCPCALFSEMFV